MKILYIGNVRSSYHFLSALLQNEKLKGLGAEVIGIVTKESSKINSDHYSLIPIAVENSIEYYNFTNNEKLLEIVKALNPDIIYCFGWSNLLPKSIVDIPKFGVIGYHPTDLPENRGRHPLIWTIQLGLKETASTFFYITEEPDAGGIINKIKVELNQNETAQSLYNKLISIGEKQVIQLTEDIINRTVTVEIQDNFQVNYWRKRTFDDGKIDWRMSALSIDRLVRSLSQPYPGAHFEYNNKNIKVWAVEIVDIENEYENIEPGKVLKVENNIFYVKTADKLLKIIDYDREFIPTKGVYL